MKAAVVVRHGKIEVRDVPPPEPAPLEALVQIEACGLCGTTDRHIVEGCQAHHPSDWYPAILGHESVGTVMATGPGVTKFRPGDRVTRPVAIWPGTNRNGLWSAWGGFAEFGIVRENPGGPDFTMDRQHVVPEGISLEDSVLAVSIAEVASWMEKIGDLDGRCVVIGGTGFAASVMGQCARARGAGIVAAVGRNPKKFEWALRNGATHCVPFGADTPSRIRDINHGKGADWFFDAAGHQAVFETGLACLHAGGQAAIYGAPEGFAYRLPLGAAGGDFSVHYLAPGDDTFYAETCRRIMSGRIDAKSIHTHTWQGLEALPGALKEQAGGEVLKGLVLIAK